jgi:transmembrane sensor
MKYNNYTIADFICDENFQNWTIRPNGETNDFWNNWIYKHPDKKHTIEEARKLLLSIKFKEDIPTSEEIQKALEKNLAEIDKIEKADGQTAQVISISRFRHLRRLAIIFLGIILVGSTVYYFSWRNETIAIAASYGEIKTLILPDGSEVILNAHSSISYLRHSRTNLPREVQLQGEAFFKVKHLNIDGNALKNSDRFIVSTKDLKIEVLGTTFDVKNRRGITDVILKTGKVRVVFNNRNLSDIIISPGEMISYVATTGQVKKFDTDPTIQTAWVDNKLILEDASVKSIIQYIEDIYGYKVILQDKNIGDKKMEGVLFLDNLPDMLFVLSTSLDIKIVQKDKTITFSNYVKLNKK